MKIEYSNIKELVENIEISSECKVIDGWQENKNYVLILRNEHDKAIRLRVPMPI